MDFVKDFLKKYKMLIVLAVSISIITSAIVMICFYYSTPNKNLRTLKDLCSEINIVNNSLEKGIKDFTIDTESSSDILKNASNSLKVIMNNVSSLDASSDTNLNSLKLEVTNALNSSVNLYDYSAYIIGNLKDLDLSSELSKFAQYKDDYVTSYNKIDPAKLNLSLSKEAVTFFDNAYNYLNTVIKVTRDDSFRTAQKRDFILQLESLNPILEELNQDLNIALKKIREDNRDIQVILNDLDKKEQDFNELKNKLASISVPDGYMDFYDALNDYLKIYDVYLTSMKDAVNFEKNCTDKDKYKKEILRNYKNCSSKYDDTLKSYNSYKKLFKN